MSLFLQSGYTSIRDVAVSFVGFFGHFILNRFNTRNALKTLNCPLLLMHGNIDEVIPYHMSETLHNSYTGNQIKYFHTANGRGHNDMSFDSDLAIPMSHIISEIEEYRTKENIIIPPPPSDIQKIISDYKNPI